MRLNTETRAWDTPHQYRGLERRPGAEKEQDGNQGGPEPGGFSMDRITIDFTPRTISKRCVQCSTVLPTCPDCLKDEVCLIVPQDCNDCTYATCMDSGNTVPQSQKMDIGAIAGATIGGTVLVCFLVFMLWRFRVKKEPEQPEQNP